MGRKRPSIEEGFAKVASDFDGAEGVIAGGTGFGASGLEVNGRIFAMVSSKGWFVVKLPRERVDELVARKKGRRFEPSPGRLMKEWFATAREPSTWTALAREAYRFVKGA